MGRKRSKINWSLLTISNHFTVLIFLKQKQSLNGSKYASFVMPTFPMCNEHRVTCRYFLLFIYVWQLRNYVAIYYLCDFDSVS